MTTFAVRPFREEDREAVVAGCNKTRPAHHQSTVAESERQDTQKPTGQVELRLCVGDPAFAYLDVVDRGTTARRRPGVCDFTLWVAPELWSETLAEALHEKLMEFAQGRDAKRLTTYLTLYAPDDPFVPFLRQRGFTEVDRIIPIMLDLTAFDRAHFPSPAPEGIHFFSYAEVGDTNENRRRLYALGAAVDQDLPTNEGRPELRPFEEWQKRFDRPERDPNAEAVAVNDTGEWIGMSQLSFQESTNIGWTNLTGVRREYRGRGIAFALKLRVIDAAIARGCRLILTENHENNAPMRAVNKKLGFVPDAPAVSYGKDL